MQYITSELSGAVRKITLNRPEVLNAINADMHWELEEAFDRFAAAADEHICVVTGAGRTNRAVRLSQADHCRSQRIGAGRRF